ncbi:hypothetical protein P7K49_024287 [Saguinus oedipus]|uniref:Uncharacterized protein n=1 Tax=Saguinus oedipus TaxID=9490 RepID=A0ABQ9UP32_SAGOE|nr:hypothetical protein P7K49_024287 [Saguinus oedipus]
MDDLSDKGNRFHHSVIRQRRSPELRQGGPRACHSEEGEMGGREGGSSGRPPQSPCPSGLGRPDAWFRIELETSGEYPPAWVGPGGRQESRGTWFLNPRVAGEEARGGRLCGAAGRRRQRMREMRLALPGWGEEEVAQAVERCPLLSWRIRSELRRRSAGPAPLLLEPQQLLPALAPLLAGEKPFVS